MPQGGAGGTGGTAAGTGVGGASTGGASGGTGGSATGGGGGASTGGASGGTGGSATGGAGASGSGGGAGANGSPCDDALFCEDFEAFTTGNAPGGDWQASTGSAESLTIDETHRLSGTRALLVSVPSGPGGAYAELEGDPVFPIAGNAFYGRMMVWLAAAPEAAVHWTFVEARGLIDGETYRAAYRLGGQHPVESQGMFAGSQLMANYETPDSYSGNGPGSDCWQHADERVLPTERWACIEWFYDGPNDAITMWVDDEEVVSVTGTGQDCVSQNAGYPWTAPSFDTLRLGWESYQTDGSRTLWIDDVVLHTNRVGCPSVEGGS
jgi:hypothetical protein